MIYFHGRIFFSIRSCKVLRLVYTRGKTIRGNGPTELTIIGFIALHSELLRAIPETLLQNGTLRNRCATTARRTRYSVIQIALAHTRIIIIIIIIIIIPPLIATAFPGCSTC